MAKISDMIEDLINQMIQDNSGSVEISRNELAEQLNCVPSQITYVISTRFTNGQGYVVESRRGGGGSIRSNGRVFDTGNVPDARCERA